MKKNHEDKTNRHLRYNFRPNDKVKIFGQTIIPYKRDMIWIKTNIKVLCCTTRHVMMYGYNFWTIYDTDVNLVQARDLVYNIINLTSARMTQICDNNTFHSEADAIHITDPEFNQNPLPNTL